MPGGAYIALSGLKTRMEQIDRVATDIANGATSGYKSQRATTMAAERERFDAALQSAIDVMQGPAAVDFRPGDVAPTGRDLDFAIEGPGFFVIETPGGLRYTRSGHFSRLVDGTLVTPGGHMVQGEDGPLRLEDGPISIGPDGTLRANGKVAGKPKVVDFDNYGMLARVDGSSFRVPNDDAAEPAENSRVTSGVLEQSNVSIAERIAELTEVSRSFEALQRGITTLMNDIDGRAITELGRR
ncbi:MAG: flagellar hook basal-body protein [Acidobacteria bacterium]|nr:flagellar hook basal-body protein [Acidobacteriota bacterium]